MKITIDTKKCISCGACESICPETFKMSEEKGEVKARVKRSEVKELVTEKDAADCCPVQAITIK
jgi:ferredoxin